MLVGITRYLFVLRRVVSLGGVGLGLRQYVRQCYGSAKVAGGLKYLFNLVGRERVYFLCKVLCLLFNAHFRKGFWINGFPGQPFFGTPTPMLY